MLLVLITLCTALVKISLYIAAFPTTAMLLLAPVVLTMPLSPQVQDYSQIVLLEPALFIVSQCL